MPGSSLWLTPPPSHPLYDIITRLIETTLPALLVQPDSSSVFAPHLTLTSNIEPAVYGSDPQPWLDSLPFAAAKEDEKATVLFERVKSEDVFFRRCYLQCSLTDSLRRLAGVARAWGFNGDGRVDQDNAVMWSEKTEKWLQEWNEAFGPHVSLMYGDTPIEDTKLNEVAKAVHDAGIALKESATNGLAGWEGGVVWLVSTEKSISEWKPIATRIL